jgi:hypothetical protein
MPVQYPLTQLRLVSASPRQGCATLSPLWPTIADDGGSSSAGGEGVKEEGGKRKNARPTGMNQLGGRFNSQRVTIYAGFSKGRKPIRTYLRKKNRRLKGQAAEWF